MKSLEKQLRTSLTTVLVLMLVVLVFIANFSTRSLMEEFVTSHLDNDAKRLVESLDIASGESREGVIDPIYNTLNSGHYYAIKLVAEATESHIIYSPSLGDKTILMPKDSELSHTQANIIHNIPGPNGERLVVWSKAYHKEGHGIVVVLAEDMSLLIRNRRYFNLLFIGMGLLGFILLFLLQHFIIRQQFKHFDRVRQEIKQVESGERQQLSKNVPIEIYPLVTEFNQSLSLMQQRVQRSRHALGNLVHALKTPLSILMQQLDLEGDEIHQQATTIAKRQAQRIQQLTERELKRARLAGQGNTTQRFKPREELPTLVDVIKQAHQKNDLDIQIRIDEKVTAFGDREDMLELLGNLMDNACKWAQMKVDCALVFEKDEKDEKEDRLNIKLTIEDDGNPKNTQELEQIAQRGIRLDESVEGYGLGLAICKDIVKLYAGTIHFDRSEALGGFKVTVILPQTTCR